MLESRGTKAPGRLRALYTTARPTLLFVLCVLLLDVMVNVRYPATEPAFWYLIPSVDVIAILLYLAVFATLGRPVPTALRVGVVVFLFVVRVVRLGDGVQEQYYSQPFNLYTDLPLVPELVRFAYSTLGWWQLALGVPLLLMGLALVALALYRALAYAETYLSRDRHIATMSILGAASFLLTMIGGHEPQHDRLYWSGFATSIVPRLRHEAKFVLNVYSDRAEFRKHMQAVEQRLASTPADLSRLRGKNVLLFLVESYGQTVFDKPAFARTTADTFARFERDLGARGFGMASGGLDSPTYGGRSWLAHATLSTGVRTQNQLQHELVCAAKPKAIARFFHAAGYRTVLAQPGTTREWPKGEFYGFDQKYFAWNFEYQGPSYAWATMPDQYVVDYVRRRELEAPAQPLFIEYVLVSSHAPWSEQPVLVSDWSKLGNGAIYGSLETVRYPIEWPRFENASDAYVRSIVYDFEVLERYIADYVKDDSLVIVIGDHQPVAEVNGHSESHGVPVHVISRDPALLAPFVARGYAAGMRPPRRAKWPAMETFLPDFLADYSTPRVRP